MFDRRIKADAYDVIVAGELLAIDNRALRPESRRRRSNYEPARFPELLCDHSDAESADILGRNDFKNSRLMKAG
jgi:hypothetical protein